MIIIIIIIIIIITRALKCKPLALDCFIFRLSMEKD